MSGCWFARWAAIVVAVFMVFACSGSGEETADGDKENGEAEEEAACLPFGSPCVDNGECCGQICYPHGDDFFCTDACSSDNACAVQQVGACCMAIQGQNLCMLSEICGGPDADGDPDGDGSDGDGPDGDGPVCVKNDLTCQDTWVLRCNLSGTAWEPYIECNNGEYCEGGQCKIPDGDVEETDGDEMCGDVQPLAILKRAENIFRPDESSPPELARIVNSTNTEFEDGTYVQLAATESGGELVFNFDVDLAYKYIFLIDYVCGPNWGEASLFFNDETSPIMRGPEEDPKDRIDLHCPNIGLDEKPLKKILYIEKCLPEGEHKLRFRVVGKNQNSEGYTIGVDYIAALPYIPEEER
ncbi:MAG: hypothetical protein C4523_02200 [Myxococcales bacterium]|nr:MAG: hypothetical protein C4523_02200 [Myxococcales bacterium]